MIAKLVLFQIGKANGGEGRQQRRARIDSAIVNRIPYRSSSTLDVGRLINLFVLLDSVVVADDAFGAIEAGRYAAKGQ